ncbi:MAG: peptidylprolyl isomerase [Bacteroidota bacterium]
MKRLIVLILCLLSLPGFAAKPKHQYVRITTDMGACIIMLYNETPLHRDNFLKLTKSKIYDGTLFHRVIKTFMIQGGDPDSKTALSGAALGNGDVGYTVPAEFRDSLFHKKGVLAAARDDNPEKASSGSQFYIVQGKVLTDPQLDSLELNRLKYKIPEWKRNVYQTVGGVPHLDNKYTVYGEVVLGIEMIDKIAEVAKDDKDRPSTDIKMTVTILKKREIRRLEKQLKRINQKK